MLFGSCGFCEGTRSYIDQCALNPLWQIENKERLAKVRVFPHGAPQAERGIGFGARIISGEGCVRLAGFCEQGNEHRSRLRKNQGFLDYVCARQLFKIYFPAVNWRCLIRSSCPQFLVLSKGYEKVEWSLSTT